MEKATLFALKIILLWQALTFQANATVKEIVLFVNVVNEDMLTLSSSLQEQSTPIHVKTITAKDPYIFKNNEVIVALGFSSYKEARSRRLENVIIGSYITSIQYRSFEDQDNKYDNDQKVVLYTDPEITQQFRLAKCLFPTNPTISVFVSDASRFLENDIRLAAKLQGIQLVVIPFAVNEDFFRGMQRHKRFDAVLALPDINIYNRNSLKAILETTYFENTSIIGYSKGMVNAGALATTSLEIPQIAQEIIKEIQQYDKTKTLGVNRYVQSDAVIVNKSVADSLNIVVPEMEYLNSNLECAR